MKRGSDENSGDYLSPELGDAVMQMPRTGPESFGIAVTSSNKRFLSNNLSKKIVHSL